MARAKSRENEMNGNSRSCAATQKLVNCVNTADAQHSLCMRRMGEHRITTIQLMGLWRLMLSKSSAVAARAS